MQINLRFRIHNLLLFYSVSLTRAYAFAVCWCLFLHGLWCILSSVLCFFYVRRYGMWNFHSWRGLCSECRRPNHYPLGRPLYFFWLRCLLVKLKPNKAYPYMVIATLTRIQLIFGFSNVSCASQEHDCIFLLVLDMQTELIFISFVP
jgi:hypothetical protein